MSEWRGCKEQHYSKQAAQQQRQKAGHVDALKCSTVCTCPGVLFVPCSPYLLLVLARHQTAHNRCCGSGARSAVAAVPGVPAALVV